ncbi:MAG: CotH kinase family protein [Eubacteriales bacterium]|nr:CotH kinase family protein [Eubacteriales bacterium]MDD4421789.1 CotH kinase family protein [Eubacteriales bacterium]
MDLKRKIPRSQKRDAMIAVLLACCVMLAVCVGVLLSRVIGTPVVFDGNIENIKVNITEVCTRNRSIICDSNGRYSDYIELYNAGISFDLNGFALSDNAFKEVKYVFGSREFASGQYMLIFLDGTNVAFSLKGEGGENLYFLSPGGDVCASVTTIEMDSDMVMVLKDGTYEVTAKASPGYPNTEEGIASYQRSLTDVSGIFTISELITSNKSALPDREGNFSDIIEIKNISSAAASTSGWYVSDNLGNPHRYALPDITLMPGEYLLVFCDGKSSYNDSEIHASFGLSEGEVAVLSGPDGRYTSVDVERIGDNISICRTTDDDGNIVYKQMSPSPGFDNTEDGILAFTESRIDRNAAIIISELLLSTDELAYGGKVCDVIELMNISENEVSTKGWFLSDDELNPYKYSIPETILKAHECICIIADSRKTPDDGIHANFSLSQGECVYLMTPEKKQSEILSVAPAGRGKSWQYIDDAGDGSYIAQNPSLGFPNDDFGRDDYNKKVRPEGIEISEVVSVNNRYIPGPYGTYHDFIELHNNSNKELSLSGLYLSDDSDNLNLAALPDIKVAAGGYIVLILSSDGVNTPSGYEVLPFALSAQGETVYLSSGGEVIDCIAIPALEGGMSYGRAGGRDGFGYLSEATPKKENASELAERAEKPEAVLEPGVYNNTGSLSVELRGKGTVRYTLDCTEPTAASPAYKSPIIIDKTTIIRARCFEQGHLPSEVLDLSYIINENDKLEVVSLVTEPENLWNYYTGIYEKGPNADPVFPYVGANFWQKWEKKATVAFFASDGTGFSEPCGIRIFGAYSRAAEKKSFTCFFRGQYGASELKYRLFKDSDLSVYEAFVLRNMGQDYNRARIRDEMMTSLVAENTTVDVQKYRPVILYLNGEYWGIYYIREKINENYIAGNYNISEESVILSVANGNSSAEYKELISYVSRYNLADEEHYNYVASKIDIENYIDYICAEMYVANTDNGNIRFFKSSELDGKWRWIFYDLDWAFLDFRHNSIFEHLNPEGTGAMNAFSTRLINSLLKNQNFKEQFLTRMAWQMQNIWTNEKVLGRINELKELINDDMKRDCERWEYSYSYWDKQIQILITFQENRHEQLYNYIKNYFSLNDAKMTELGFQI